MTFNLRKPPYLQISLDAPDLKRAKEIITSVPKSNKIILEAGTPLIKRYGINVISELRRLAEDAFFVADMKTLDAGSVEVNIAYEGTANAVVAAGLAPTETLNSFIYEARRLGMYAIVDMLNVDDPIRKLETIKEFPDVVVLHRGIDQETRGSLNLRLIRELRQAFSGKKFLIAVAGGMVPKTAKEALMIGADIIVVGRYITQSSDVERAISEFLKLMP